MDKELLWGGVLTLLLLRVARIWVCLGIISCFDWQGRSLSTPFFLPHCFVSSSLLAPHMCSGLCFSRRLCIARATTRLLTALKIGEGWILRMMELLVSGLVGVRHDLTPLMATTDAWRHCLGPRRFSRTLAFLIFWWGMFWHSRGICHIIIVYSRSREVLFPRSLVGFLVPCRYFLTRLPVRSRGLMSITAEVPANKIDRQGRQCHSYGPSLTLALGK